MTKSRAKPTPVAVGRYRYTKRRWRLLVRAFDVLGGAAMRAWRLFRPAPRPVEPKRFLIIQLDHLGDAVLTSPLINRLREAHPSATIDVLASPSNREVFEADPRVDRVRLASRNWFERKRGSWALASAVWTLGRSLRGGGYDVGIDVRGDLLSVLVLVLAGIPRRIGWSMGGGGFLLTDVAPWIPGRHEVKSRLALLARLGIASDEPARVEVHVEDVDRAHVATMLATTWPDFAPTPAGPSERRTRPRAKIASNRVSHQFHDQRNVQSHVVKRDVVTHADLDADWLHAGRFGAAAPLLAVHLGAGTAAKRWPTRHWDGLIARFLEEGWRVVVVGGSDDVETSRGLRSHPNLSDWTGRLTVPRTTALLERADLFLGADSGPAHLAAAAGVVSVVLFSGTNRPAQWRPWSRRSLVLRARVACRPCHQKVCPLFDHPCMTGLDPERVHRAARLWWSRIHRQESPHVPI